MVQAFGQRTPDALPAPRRAEGCSVRAEPDRGLRELIDALQEQGCHEQDIGDALSAVDPDWVSHLGPSR